jgi:ATP-binding cassette subfamily B protein
LKAINLHIPFGKTTAIVGSSGSGKTTLLKLLLKFYEPEVGQILINGQNLNDISAKWWRRKCGVVMQEGYIFSDTIRKNISTGDEFESEEKLWHAARVANIEQFIHSNPLQLETKIGDAGSGLSTGQKQRLLIARAVYKDPEIFLFDEATSSLDSKNEREIVTRLREAVTGRTMIIIAHRLSTVRNADKIVVLEDGEIVEEGDHAGLINSKGRYFTLVKNQLELDG